MISELSGRVAVITGGASGIGRALAVACRDQGMRVVIADVEEAALEATCTELGIDGKRTDVCDPDSVKQLAEYVQDHFGGCDLLCNNAGVGGFGRIVDQTLNDWNWIIDVNLRGVVHVLHAFLPSMTSNPNPTHIVNTASIAGLTAVVSGPYTATKYAVVGISETLRHELADSSVGVSVLCPGLVRTQINRSQRNRPERLANDSNERRASTWALPLDTKPVVIEPEAVATMVLDAVRTGEFWILTDPSLLALAWPRYQELEALAFGSDG